MTIPLTPWCRVLLEKLTGLQLVKKLPAFHGTRKFITELTSVRHLSLPWASPIQPIYTHPTSWRSILILSAHLLLGLPSGLLPSGFPTKIPYTTLSSPRFIDFYKATVSFLCSCPNVARNCGFWHYTLRLYFVVMLNKYCSYYIHTNNKINITLISCYK